VAGQTPEQLQQLVAPSRSIRMRWLRRSSRLAYPMEIVEADRWVQQHSDLKANSLPRLSISNPGCQRQGDRAVSLRAGKHGQEPLMDVVAGRRVREPAAGRARRRPDDAQARPAGRQPQTSPQENVVTQARRSDPAGEPDVVYVPTYDPWLVYGPPVVAYPGWFWYPGLYAVGPGISFGFGFGIGFFGGFGWGFHHWASTGTTAS